KFIWSTDAPLGATCNRIRNPLLASDSIVLRTGASSGDWSEETIDPEALFREHFLDGDPNGDIPELQGIGLLRDGDQTNSMSEDDCTGFVLSKCPQISSIPSRDSGRVRRRLPVAACSAFATAGATGATDSSPTPPGFSSLSRITTSISGIC